MNPVTAAPAVPRPMVNDVAQPAAPTPTLITNLVTDIPVHTPQAAAPAAPAGEDGELDKIMQDVGRELKKEDHTKKPGRFSLFARKKKPSVTVQPAAPVASAAPVQPPAPQPAAASSVQPVAPAASAAKKQPASSAPVMVVMVTIVVTGLLMAAAFYTYK